MKAWILLGTLLLLLAGCTSAQYVKAGSTDTDFEDDNAECTQQILKATIEANLAAESSGPYEKASTTPTANAPLRQRLEQCLQSRGWRRESRSE